MTPTRLPPESLKHCVILGTRPEIIKLSPIIRELQKRSRNFFILHTNQHYSKEMDEIFFKELGLVTPKYNLSIGSDSHGAQTARMLTAIESVLQQERPTHLYVQGDTNTVVAGVLAGAKEQGMRIAHVEAGLRSYDRDMPEEINRIIADHISNYLFAPGPKQESILLREGIGSEKVFVVGNTIVDALEQNKVLAMAQSTIMADQELKARDYAVLTLHRPANVDDRNVLTEMLKAINELGVQHDLTIVFPVHPRTKKNIETFGLELGPKIRMIQSVGYLDMIQLLENARLIATDSGGVQEEACILHVPCITLRNNTERPETIEVGGNMIAGQSRMSILAAANVMFQKTIAWSNPFGDGHTAKKIIDIIEASDV